MTSKRILIYLLTALTLVLAKRPFTFNIDEIACIRYAEPVAEFHCHLDTVNNQTVISGYMTFSGNVTKTQVKVNVDLLSAAGTPMKLFDVIVDGCKMLATVEMSTIVKSIMTQLKQAGHFPEGCPVLANENYTLNGFALDADIFPHYTPEFKYALDLRIMSGSNVVVAKILAKGNVQSKKKTVYLRT